MARLSVRFWGVRGSMATPGRSTAKYGGNTACVEVRCGDELLIFDMGSGLREFGNALAGSGPIKASFFLSHYHWDHILGLPFFAPAYDPESSLQIHGATRLGKSAREILAGQMINPYFPVSLGEFRASLEFRNIESGGQVAVGDALVTAQELSHPGGGLGFRVESEGTSVVYATDFEHGTEADDTLVELARDTDLLIYDATYTVAEYRKHKGWGHSTWAEGVKIAKKAKARKLILFHHDPSHDDAAVDEIQALARARFPSTDAAKEGKVYNLSARPKRSSKAAPRRSAALRRR